MDPSPTIYCCYLEYCVNSQLDSWEWCQAFLLRASENTRQSDVLKLQFWGNQTDAFLVTDSQCKMFVDTSSIDSVDTTSDGEWDIDTDKHYENVTPLGSQVLLLEFTFSVKCCAVGIRTRSHFMFNTVPGGVESDWLFVVNEDNFVNLRGGGSEELVHVIQSKRCIEHVDHTHACKLDRVFYVCTDIGEVDSDETEFLLVVTQSDVSVVSLQRHCITRAMPFTKIKTFSQDKFDPTTVVLELGSMRHGGSRTYSFRSKRAGDILSAIRDQINIISSIIVMRRESDGKVDRDETVDSLEKTIYAQKTEILDADSSTISECGTEYSRLACPNLDQNMYQTASLKQPNLNDELSEYHDDIASQQDFISGDYSPPDTDIYPHFDQTFDRSAACRTLEQGVRSRFSEQNMLAAHEHSLSEISYDSTELSYDSTDISSYNTGGGGEYNMGGRGELCYTLTEPCANVIYQEVDIDVLSPRHSTLLRRRRSRKFSKPTFVSYVIGGTEALVSLDRLMRRKSAPAVTQGTVSDYEGPGVYSRLFDPTLFPGEEEQQSRDEGQDEAYDLLIRK